MCSYQKDMEIRSRVQSDFLCRALEKMNNLEKKQLFAAEYTQINSPHTHTHEE